MRGQGGVNYPELRGRSGRGLLCYNSVTKKAADVICRQTLGLFGKFLTRLFGPPPGYDGVYYSGRIECSGGENYLSECDVIVSPQSTCRDGYSIVICTSGISL